MEDGESYLRRHHVLFYLEDAVAQLITSDVRRRPPTQPSSKDDENAGKRQSAGPKAKSAVDFLEEYFADVVNSKQVAFREYSYIRATPQNRRAFLMLLWDTLRPVGGLTDMLSVVDYFSIINLICEDFPFVLVRSVAALVLVDVALDCLLPFTDFFPAFQLLFFFQEFVEQCRAAYDECSIVTSTTMPSLTAVKTADFLANLATQRKPSHSEEWFMDLEIVKSALPMDLIESHDTMLFQLSKCDAVHAAIETISLKWMKESHAN